MPRTFAGAYRKIAVILMRFVYYNPSSVHEYFSKVHMRVLGSKERR